MIMTEKVSAPERLPFSCGLKYFTKASLLFYGDAVFVFTIDFVQIQFVYLELPLYTPMRKTKDIR